MKLSFTLNGTPTTLETPADRRVVDLLREDLRLRGTKESCGSGDCGACTVLVDGESRLSCLMLAAQLEGRSVVTVEGLAADGRPSALQEAFAAHGAVQCGYCTPGMLLSAADLLSHEAAPDRQAIREALSGNLCRCTGYAKIVEAVEAAAAERRTP